MDDNISSDSKPRLSPGTVYEEKSVRVFARGEETRHRAFNPLHATFCLLNHTGGEVVTRIDGGRTVGDIARELAEQYQVGVEEVLPHVLTLMKELKEHKLVFMKGELTPPIVETTAVTSPEEVWLNITNKCNLRCRTCFKDSGTAFPDELPFEDLRRIMDQMFDLNAKRVVVSGGEPMIREDIFDILKYLVDGDVRILFVTNGTLIGEKEAEQLGKIRPHVIQVSIDGSRPEVNDRIRGKGSFEKTLRAAELLVEQGLDVRLYPTVTKWNIYDLPNIKKLVLKLRPGFNHMSCAKFVAIGRGSQHEQELELEPEEFYEAFVRMPVDTYSTPEIINKIRAAQEEDDLTGFVPDRIAYGCRKVNCGIASGTFSIDSDGKVYPCQWMHMPDYLAGDLTRQSLEQIYYSSPIFMKCRSIRVDTDIPTCTGCEYKYFCGGACRARALLKNGSMYAEDPDCFYIKKFFETGFWAENIFSDDAERLTELEMEYQQALRMQEQSKARADAG